MKKVSIIIPCYNEEENISLLYMNLIELSESTLEFDWEFLFINDGSNDSTYEVLSALRTNDKRVCIVDLSRNFGKEAAMLAGFDYCKGDCVVIMDADLQHPPLTVVEMLKYWEEGYEDVYAKRKVRGNESWIRKKATLSYYKLLQKTTKVQILQNVGDFRLLDRVCINVLKQLRERERYTKGLFAWIGFRKKEIFFDQGDRVFGKTSWNFSSLFSLAIDGITSFTILPLRISTVVGLLVSLISFVYMIVVFFKTIFLGETVQGFPTLLIVILFLGGVQLLSLGIIGEYLGRIFNETKKRPVYIAKSYNNEKII